ncbi:hypothetical protein EZS27_007840 [termite gut metagenome]|uniref:Uncharacterized protein n=1 Tax=termite gut metagenome TaxID=433724 RepID=A0A5J4SGP0_9ZZZZ
MVKRILLMLIRGIGVRYISQIQEFSIRKVFIRLGTFLYMIIRNHTTTLKKEVPTNIVEASIEIKIDAHAPVI